MKNHIFITGISTEVGKTISSAIVVESLQADYWKPIQSGELNNSDTMKVQQLISNEKTQFFPNAYGLHFPASPHFSAELENITIELDKIVRPETKNTLVIEGAGGLFVPLNKNNTILDLIQPTDKVILVSRHYLGSINHTILSIEALKNRNISISGIIFSGKQNISTENWIKEYTNIPIIGRIDEEPYFGKNIIKEYADIFHENLVSLLTK
ncbi:MAG: dethiobiotin synthase [Capnocytophaga sp.]|nr:dethiobiotin synthase [Capnocytophaga sp.]